MVWTRIRRWRKARREKRDSISLVERTKRRARRIILTVVLMVVFVCLFCLLTGLVVGRVSAHALQAADQAGLMRDSRAHQLVDDRVPASEDLDVVLVIDNSNSMFDLHGIGSDPELRRIEGAQLFIHYLGVDSATADHRLAVISFGGTARCVVPLTHLESASARQEMAHRIANPGRMDWTDPATALRLAAEILEDADGRRREVVVLLTDGKPEWPSSRTNPSQADVLEELASTGQMYADRGTQLFVVLLANEATDADPEIAEIYVPLWEELTAATGGQFHTVREAEDLIEVYHDVLLNLSGMASDGAVVEATVLNARKTYTIPIEAGLEQVNLTIWTTRGGLAGAEIEETTMSDGSQRAASPTGLTITLRRPDGRILSRDDRAVRQSGYVTTEVWAVDEPEPGSWTVVLEGEGAVTIWKDTPSAPTTPTLTPAPMVTSTPTPTATSTPVSDLIVEDWPDFALAAEPIVLSVRIDPEPEGPAQLTAAWMRDGQVLATSPLLDDGRFDDRVAGDGIYTGSYTPAEAGVLEVRVRGSRLSLPAWQGRLQVVARPALVTVLPKHHDTWHLGETEEVRAEWRLAGETLAISGPLTVTITDEAEVWRGRVGQPLNVTAPTARGSYTVTLQASGITPTGQAISDARTVEVWVRRRIPGWIIGTSTFVTVAVATGFGIRVWLRRQPALTGRLRVLAAPAGFAGSRLIDLSSERRFAAKLGGVGSILEASTEDTPWADLKVTPDESVELVPIEGAEVSINGTPVRGQKVLQDQDIIEIRDLKLRYENPAHRSKPVADAIGLSSRRVHQGWSDSIE